MTLGERLAMFRKANGIKQGQLADALGVSRQCMSNYESGRNFPTIATMITLADYYGVPLDYLVGRNAPQISEEMEMKPLEYPKNKFEVRPELPETGDVTVSLVTVMEAAEHIETARQDIEKAIKALRPDMLDWKKGIEKDARPSVRSLYEMYCQLDEQWRQIFNLDIEVPVDLAQLAFNKTNPLSYPNLAKELRETRLRTIQQPLKTEQPG